MESMFLWIIMFAGAAVLLLGVFLIASERELKKKRGEIDQLLDRLETAQAPAPASVASDGAEANGLRTKTQELLGEIASLQDDLDAAHRAINELRAGKPDAANETTLAQVEQLRYANTQLDTQVEELRGQLQASEARWASAAGGDNQQRQTQLENGLIDLKQQLERSQARVRELESAPAPDMALREGRQREETDKLEARIAQLQESLNAAAESACQADILRQQLSESNQAAQELRETLRQRDEELPRWREQIASSEEFKKRLIALHPVYDQLVAKQNTLIDQQRAYHGELKSFAEFLSASHDGAITPTTYTYFDPQSASEASLPTQLTLTPLAAAEDHGTSAALAAPAAASSVQANGDGAASPAESKAGFGIFHALIALVVSGALVALFLSQSGDNPSANAAKPLPQSAPAQKTAPQPPSPPSEVASASVPAKPAVAAPASAQAPAKKIPPAAVAAAGVYQVTQATRVFAAPAEYAQQIGEIEPGLKVTVVNSRDGWLEIHSKHGRPPGFIRSHTAARIDG